MANRSRGGPSRVAPCSADCGWPQADGDAPGSAAAVKPASPGAKATSGSATLSPERGEEAPAAEKLARRLENERGRLSWASPRIIMAEGGDFKFDHAGPEGGRAAEK